MEKKFTKKTIKKAEDIRAFFEGRFPNKKHCKSVEPDVCPRCYELCEIINTP